MRRLLLLVLLSSSLAACNVDPYTLTFDEGDSTGVDADDSDNGGDSGGGDNGGDGGDMDDIDGGDGADIDADLRPDACLPSVEVCNGQDDDCDGEVDETFDLTQDPNNCGSCGNACTYPNAVGKCQTSECVQTACQSGYIDTDPNTPGCEYACIPTNNGVEICDLVDNNCDTIIDEGFNVDDDVNNCGACGNKCVLLHATPKCVDADGDGLGKCEVLTCQTGFVDNNPDVPGCEYQCTKSNGGVEICDGIDNDCDEGLAGGGVDEGNPGGGATCGTSAGECTAGTTVCSFGNLQCVGAIGGNPEICDNLDNDCDNTVDDGFDKNNDINHCGSCNPCNVPFATPKCTTGMCGIQACQFGHQNNDGNQVNGCEYACIPTSSSELCDGVDNDCDKGLPGGGVDEGFNLQTDVNNCGMCGKTCSFANASASCVAGGCVQGACLPGFFDISPTIPGCEYACTKSNGGVEICDNFDNDCDGTADEGNPGGGVACGTNTGECNAGTQQCLAGSLVCQNATGPVAETCDNKDNDCDNTVDDGFDKQNDPTHCGTNCTVCSFANAFPKCTAGVCGVAACQAGFVDADGNPGNGCEYACTPSGIEICDGVDNDCDKLVDAADPSMNAPPAICRTQGECAGTSATCSGMAGWVCNYTDPDVETSGGVLVLEESRCDNKDNDCDGGSDEVFPLKNTACAEDGTFGTVLRVGICRGTGTLQCQAGMPAAGLKCNITVAGATAVDEICDNKDNDCDGVTDEQWDGKAFPAAAATRLGVRDSTVSVAATGATAAFKIYDFEATRPDATGATAGFVETRACSISGRLPWGSSSFTEAQTACNAAGMRLCKVTRNASGVVTADEWGRACQADGDAQPFDTDYPYGASYGINTCNGSDYDPIAGTPDNEDQAVASGALASCVSSSTGVNDLSGNLKEWVDDPRVAAGTTVYTLRGGAFDNGSGGLTCDFSFTVAEPDYFFPNVGFRCCARECPLDNMMVQADCGGTCRNLSNNASHCGACGKACGGGNTCQNGKCCPTGQVNCSGVCCASCSATGVCQ